MGDAAGLRAGHHRRAPGLPARLGRLRCQSPGYGAGGRARTRSTWAPGRSLQRPPAGGAGAGPVHPPARRRRRIGGRRHHRLVAVRRHLRRHAQRLEHRPGGGRHRGRGHHLRRAASWPYRARTPGPAWPRWPRTLRAVARFRVAPFVWEGVACVAAGTGYTGEDGVELCVPADAADALWTALLATGIEPAGLGARDTLRLEAALPLHGHELGPGITPLQAGLGWVVGWDKGPVPGSGRPRGRAHPGGGPSSGRVGHRGSPTTEGGGRADAGRPDRRQRHQRQLLAHARPRDRPRASSTAARSPDRPRP